MVHIAGKRYQYRPEKVTTVKVYSNQKTVSLYANGKLIAQKTADKIFEFRVTLEKDTVVEAIAGDLRDTAVFHYTSTPLPEYRLNKKKAGGGNWTKE